MNYNALDDDVSQAPPSSDAITSSPSQKKFADDKTPPDQTKEHLKKEIAQRYARKRTKPGIGLRMLRDLRKLFADRYEKLGPAMPEGDDGALDDFLILINYTAMLGDYRALRAAKERWQPSLAEAAFDTMVAEVIANPLYLTPNQLGARVGLYDAKRTELDIRSIDAVDCTKQQRIERRKMKKVEKRKAKRAALRELRPAPASETKPWLAFGRSRSWWHAHGKPTPPEIGQNLTPHKLSFLLRGVNNCPTGALPPFKGRRLARAVPALSAVDTPISTGTPVSQRVFPAAARARETTTTVSLETAFNIRAVKQIDDGTAAKRVHNMKEKPMTITKLTTAAEVEHLESYLDAMLSEYRRAEARDAARTALRKALDESDDPVQTRTLIAEAVHDRGRWFCSREMTLAQFIEGGSWRAENLPFNRIAAA